MLLAYNMVINNWVKATKDICVIRCCKVKDLVVGHHAFA